MTFAVLVACVALVGCVLVGRSARSVVRVLAPAQAVVLLTVASLAVSLACGVALTAVAVAVIGTLSSVAANGHWSAAVLRAEVPIPEWLGAVAAAMVVTLLARAAVRTVGIGRALIRADRLCRELRSGGGPVVIVDDDSADAYTVAGMRGCVVISRRLIAELDADERQVLTAHELSHLRRRHHLYVHVADIAASANPLLHPVSAAVRLGVERWADEDAATGIGDRRITGRALARVALLRSALGNAALGNAALAPLGVVTLQVVSRVQALLQPAPRRRTRSVVAAVTLSIAVLIVGLQSLASIEHAIESAAFQVNHSVGR